MTGRYEGQQPNTEQDGEKLLRIMAMAAQAAGAQQRPADTRPAEANPGGMSEGDRMVSTARPGTGRDDAMQSLLQGDAGGSTPVSAAAETVIGPEEVAKAGEILQRYKTGKGLDVGQYIHDDSIDTTDKSVVVDWYYKKAQPGGQTVLHYCKYCNGVVLYASENDPQLAQRGFYDHGKYPFVFDPLFMEEDSPAGFGYIDVMKDTQTAIDEMNHAMDENVKLAAKQRFVLSDTAGVNEQELADFSKDIVHVVGRLNEDSFRPLQTNVLSGNCMNYRDARVSELKEVSGNRDVSQGGTTSGLTDASAIAALQEAGSKLSRDMLKSAYRAFAKECYLIIELMRQFYDEQRVYRITGESGGVEYATFSA